MAFRLMSSSSGSSSILLPVFESTWMWYPACEAFVGESTSDSFMNWSLSAANFGELESTEAFAEGLSGLEPDGSNTMSESTAQKTETLVACINNPPVNFENRALAAAQRR